MDAVLSALLNAAKTARTGGIALATWGIYGGQYAKEFPEPNQVIVAGWLCIAGMAIGLVVQTYYSFIKPFFQP